MQWWINYCANCAVACGPPLHRAADLPAVSLYGDRLTLFSGYYSYSYSLFYDFIRGRESTGVVNVVSVAVNDTKPVIVDVYTRNPACFDGSTWKIGSPHILA